MTWMKLATYALGAALVVGAFLIPGAQVPLFGAGMGLLGLATTHPLDK